MKKRLLTALLAAVMFCTTLAAPAGAAGSTRFSDLTDSGVTTAVESLRLMGVLDGYGDGTFRPDGKLNRAQFCKMLTYVMDGGSELGRYRTVTIFPDVKPSHWAAGYINLAAKGKGVISGFADGRFYPERTVTIGQAVTILVRLLGYKDEDVGGVWPDSFMAVGATIGLTDGIGAAGNAPLTRAQAAKLFMNLLVAQKKDGGTLYELSEETELLSVDGGSGVLKTSDGKSYPMAHPTASTTLTGARGRVVLNKGKALTFLPQSAGSTGNADAAVIVYEDRSAAGFQTLAGNSDYRIYKNGTLATAGDLRKNDVATYYPATNSILVCDTRVTVYYESCEPNPAAPTKIKVLNGTELHVLSTARDSLAEFKPGDQMTLLLTADGQVAGAAKPSGNAGRGNAMGVVTQEGKIQLLCGTSTIELAAAAEEKYLGQVVRVSSGDKGKISLNIQSGNVRGDLDVSKRELGGKPLAAAEEKYLGQVVRVSSGDKGKISLNIQSGNVRGDLDVSKRELGGKPLAENAMVFDGGKLIALSQLNAGLIPSGQIQYARTNWAGQVDLVVLNRKTGEIYGRVFWEVREITGTEENQETKYEEWIGVRFGNGADDKVGPFKMRYNVQNGDYVAVTLNRGNTGFSSLIELTKLDDVSKSSWIGQSAVTFGGRTYEVPEDVLCYNVDSQEWTTLEKALAYAETADLFAKDGVIRVVEVRHSSK